MLRILVELDEVVVAVEQSSIEAVREETDLLPEDLSKIKTQPLVVSDYNKSLDPVSSIQKIRSKGVMAYLDFIGDLKFTAKLSFLKLQPGVRSRYAPGVDENSLFFVTYKKIGLSLGGGDTVTSHSIINWRKGTLLTITGTRQKYAERGIFLIVKYITRRKVSVR